MVGGDGTGDRSPDADLLARVKAERFHTRQRAIYQHVIDRRAGFYLVHETGRPRTKR